MGLLCPVNSLVAARSWQQILLDQIIIDYKFSLARLKKV
jgi:hypothetical protein